ARPGQDDGCDLLVRSDFAARRLQRIDERSVRDVVARLRPVDRQHSDSAVALYEEGGGHGGSSPGSDLRGDDDAIANEFNDQVLAEPCLEENLAAVLAEPRRWAGPRGCRAAEPDGR